MKRFSVRFEDDVANELDYLATLMNKSKNDILNLLVRAEYNKFERDPKMALAIEQMQTLKETLSQMENQLKAFDEQ